FNFPPGYLPNAIAVNAAGTRALVGGDGTSLLLLDVSASPITLRDTIAVVADAGGLAFYAANNAIVADESNLLFVDVTNIPAIVTTVALGAQAHAVAVNAAGTRAVVTVDTGGLQVVDLTTNPPSLVGVVVGSLAADPLGVAISPDGTRAIYVNESLPAPEAIVVDITGPVPSVIAAVSLTVLSPSAVAFSAAGAALVAGDDAVAVLQPPYTSVSRIIAHPNRRGATSYSIAVNAAGTRALVLHEDVLFCGYPITFGYVVVNTTGTVQETCFNSSLSPVTVTAITVIGSGFAMNGAPPLPATVPPGASFSFNLTFNPVAAGPQTGGLSFAQTYTGAPAGFSGDYSMTGEGVAALPACAAPAAGLVSWWPGDGSAYDIIGGRNGLLSGNATYAPGNSRYAFSLPGAGAVDIPYSSMPTPAAITVAAWVNPASTPASAPAIFNWRPLANTTGVTLEQRFSADGQVLWNVFATGGVAGVASGTNLLPLNTWTHVVGTYDGTTATLYFNGAVLGTATTSGPLAAIEGNAKIGRNMVTGAFFNGSIDEVEVYDRALSPGSIQAIYAAGKGGHCRALLDVDGDGRTDALSDGLLLIRYLFGLTGSSLTSSAVSPGSSRSTPPVIQSYINQYISALDIDGNSTTDALTDGLLVLRYLFGLRGNSLIAGAVGAGATRTQVADIEAYLRLLSQ
ncbi:MAG: LamG-like jellyroll fold domain-containing protein, partial [Betaproteobacteria bacterium]